MSHGHHSGQEYPRLDPGLSREDFLSDEEFEKMMSSGVFEGKKPSHLGGAGPLQHPQFEPGSLSPPAPSYPQYGGTPNSLHPVFIAGQESSGAYGRVEDEFRPGHRFDRYDDAVGVSGGYGAPTGNGEDEDSAYKYQPPQGPPHSLAYIPNSEGSAYNYQPPPGPPSHPFVHIPNMAAAHDEDTDPALYHEAAQKLHEHHEQYNPSHGQHHKPHHEQHHHVPSGGEQYESQLQAHAQAYGPETESSTVPMNPDAIGQAAAIQAIKLSAAQNASQGAQQQPAASAPSQAPPTPPKPALTSGSHPTPSKPPPTSSAHPPATPATPATPAPPAPPAPPAAPAVHAATAGSSAPPPGPPNPQDKIIALAMAQAAKLFDKQHPGGATDGSNAAKVQAMKSAGLTVVRLCGEYKSTGKINLQQGEMQQLIGAALSILK